MDDPPVRDRLGADAPVRGRAISRPPGTPQRRRRRMRRSPTRPVTHIAPAPSPDCRRLQDNQTRAPAQADGGSRAVGGSIYGGERTGLDRGSDRGMSESPDRGGRGIRTKLSRRDRLASAASAEKPAATRIAVVGLVPPRGSGIAEDQRHQSGADRLAEQSRGRLNGAGAAAAFARRAADDGPIVRRLEKPEPEGADDDSPDDVGIARLGREQCAAEQSRGSARRARCRREFRPG